MKEIYGIDMEATQSPKLLFDLPDVDVVIKMGCNVVCPYLPSKYEEDWGLDDPSGLDDEVFRTTIATIEKKVKELAEKIDSFDL